MGRTPRYRLRLPNNKQPAVSANIPLFQQIQRIYLPLSYEEGSVRCHFSEGDRVFQGDRMTDPDSADLLPIRSPVEGVFESIRTLSHPLYGELACAVIRPAIMPTPQPDSDQVITPTPAQVIAAAKAAAIIDEIDGIPLYRKLEQWQAEEYDYIVANAVEAEPYADSAFALLRANPHGVANGLWLAAETAHAAGSHIALQANRQQRAVLPSSLKDRLFLVPNGYPVTTFSHAGKDVRVGMIGVQACLALHRAVTLREPHHYLYVTVAGDAVKKPQTLCVPFGTPAGELLRYCELTCNPEQIIFGDALTGVAVPSANLPVLPGITCLLALKKAADKERPCIGCGRCLTVCHAHLKPEEIARQVESMHFDRLPHLHPEKCDRCGACSCVCPMGRDVAALVAEAMETDGQIWMNWGNTDGI